MADISSQVQESLSVSGILLGKTMGRTARARRAASRPSRSAWPTSRCGSRMTGRWMMASIQTSFAVMPALVYLFGGHFAGSVSIGTLVRSRRCRRASSSRSARCSASRSRSRPPSRSSTASSSTSITGRHRGRDAPPWTRRAVTSPSTTWFRYEDARLDVAGRHRSRCRRGRRPRWSARPAPARRLPGISSRASTTSPRAGDDRRRGRPRADVRVARRRRRGRLTGDLSLPCQRARQPSLRAPGRDRRPGRGGRAGGADPRADRDLSPTATTPSSASAATASRAASASGSRSHARFFATRRSSSSTRRHRRSTRRPNARCRRRSSGWPRAGRRSRSLTASRRSATPTRSSCSTTAASSRSAHTRSCSRRRPLRRRSSRATPRSFSDEPHSSS